MSEETNWNETRKKLVKDDQRLLSHIFMDQFASDLDYEDEKVVAMVDSNEWNLSMEVNGVRVDDIGLEDFLQKMWTVNYESMIKEEAEKMMNKKWDETFGEIQEFTEKAQTILSDKLCYDWEK